MSKWLRGNTINQAEKLKIEPFSRIISVRRHNLKRRQVLPVALYNKALNIAHEGHLGITRTKTLLRSKVWFPNINKLVDSLISKCLPRELNSKGMFEPIK